MPASNAEAASVPPDKPVECFVPFKSAKHVANIEVPSSADIRKTLPAEQGTKSHTAVYDGGPDAYMTYGRSFPKWNPER